VSDRRAVCWHTSPGCLRILESLACQGDASAVELAGKVHINRNHTHILTRQHLLPAGVIHVCAWRINGRGPATPIYAIGPGANVPRPVAETSSQRAARRRKSLIELYGQEVASKVINYSRHVHVVIDGKTIRPGSHAAQRGGQIVGQIGART